MWFLPDDTSNLRRPLDIRYMKILRFNLQTISAWDHYHIEGAYSKYTIPSKVYIIFIEYFCLVTGIKYLSNNIGTLSLFELGHMYITVFMNVIACSRLTLIFMNSNHSMIVRFIKDIHTFNYKDKSDHAMKVHLTVHKLSHYTTLYLNSVTFIGICLFTGTPVYNNITSGAYKTPRPENATFQHAVYYELPFDYTTQFRGYIVLFVFNIHIAYICTSCFLAFDLLISLIIFHIWGHLKILIYDLEHFPRPNTLGRRADAKHCLFSKEESKDVHKKLRECINHHKLIIRWIAAISDTFGWVLLMYYAFHQISGCFLLLQCSQMDARALTRYGPLTLILFQQLIQISVVFELLASLYDKLSMAIYFVPWEFMDTKNRKLVFTFLRQAQKPINLKASSMVSVGVQTMVAILKTSVSYFVMLQTVAVDK